MEAYSTQGSAGPTELPAIHAALLLAQRQGWTHVRVRSADNTVRKRLKKNHAAGQRWQSSDLHGAILSLARQFVEVKFCYCPRPKSGRARQLAREAVGLATVQEALHQEAAPSFGSDGPQPTASLILERQGLHLRQEQRPLRPAGNRSWGSVAAMRDLSFDDDWHEHNFIPF
jgi:hypothetical protein